jgi:hypothetical protein
MPKSGKKLSFVPGVVYIIRVKNYSIEWLATCRAVGFNTTAFGAASDVC